MKKIILFFIEKKIFVAMLLIFFSGISFISFSRLPGSLMPESGAKNLAVSFKYEGQSPQRIERIITKPAEDSLSSAAGIKSIDSVSREGEARIYISYNDNADIKKKIFEVREKLEVVKAYFPREVHEPEIFAEGLNEPPLMILVLESSNLNKDQLREIAEKKIKKIIERSDGVSEVSVGGGNKREISVLIDDEKFYKKVSSAIQEANISIPSGETGGAKKYSVIVNEKFKTIDDIKSLPVVSGKTGNILTVDDMAAVSDYAGTKEEISRINGEEKISIYVMKSGEAKIIETAENVKKACSNIQESNFQIKIIHNQADEIRSSLNSLAGGILSGSIFAAVIVFLFLRSAGNTIPIVSAIPLSAMAVFVYMHWHSLSLNVMTLSGLALASGMAVDNGIIVLESIWLKIKNIKGKISKDTVAESTASVLKPVFASTATTVSVFIPVIFFSGDSGRVYAELAGAVIVSLTASLVISVTVIPAGAYFFLNRRNNISSFKFMKLKRIFYFKAGNIKKFNIVKNKIPSYCNLMKLLHKNRLILYAVLVFSCSASFILFFSIDKKQIDASSKNEIHASLDMPSGTSLDSVSKISDSVEKKISSSVSIDGVTAKIEKWRSDFIIKIKKSKERDHAADELKKLLSDMDLKNGFIFFHDISGLSAGEIDFDISGPDIFKIRDIAEKLAKEISGIKGASEIIYRFRDGRPEIHAVIDRQRASASGLTSGEAGDFIRSMFYGPVVSKFISSGEVDIRCRLNLSGQSAVDAIHDLVIPNDNGLGIPLREIADIRESSGITAIWHKNREIKETLTVRIKGEDQLEFLNKAEKIAGAISLPHGYFIESGGSSVKLRKSGAEMIFAIMMALLLVYMAVAAVYESFVIPFVSLISIPFSFIGVTAALLIGGFSVDVTVYMGVVVLIGITVNNSIILIDAMMDAEKIDLSEIIKSSENRIRPIMMTTLTTASGLVPMLFGSGLWNGFAATVISGLLASTLLVVFTVPVIFYDLKRFFINKLANTA